MGEGYAKPAASPVQSLTTIDVLKDGCHNSLRCIPVNGYAIHT